MVCESCESKLAAKVCVPDKWKVGAKNSIAAGGKIVGKTNKMIASLARSTYVPDNCLCRLCKTKIGQGYNYCNDCAHKKVQLLPTLPILVVN